MTLGSYDHKAATHQLASPVAAPTGRGRATPAAPGRQAGVVWFVVADSTRTATIGTGAGRVPPGPREGLSPPLALRSCGCGFFLGLTADRGPVRETPCLICFLSA